MKKEEEIKNEIAEKLNLLSLHTHTYNVDDCLNDVLEIIAKSQQPETSVEQISKALVDSLGAPIEGNNYTIHSINGERWITHNEVGSGEPLKQWIESELKKIVDAVDPTFWRRLEMFVSNIQVNDIAGEEEKQYIIHVIESKK